MIEATGDLWAYSADWFCIPTSGSVRQDGRAVMGAGVALQARSLYPGLDTLVGALIRGEGNHLGVFGREHTGYNRNLITFPTKRVYYQKADLLLIQDSAQGLGIIARYRKDEVFVLPTPGCGEGRLKWEEVRPYIEDFLPDNVHIIHWMLRWSHQQYQSPAVDKSNSM